MNARKHGLHSLASQRVAGTGRLVLRDDAGVTRIDRMYQEGAARLRIPHRVDAGLEAALINTAGGLTGGDRLDWTVEVGEGATLTATTPACERIYRSAGGPARVSCNMTVGAGGRLAWMPQETILFDNSALERTLDIVLGEDARLLVVEPVILGRPAHGEIVRRLLLRDRWRVHGAGRVLHAENLVLGPGLDTAVSARAALAGSRAFATVLCVGEDVERLVAPARQILGDGGGVSHWRVGGTGKLLARLLAPDGYGLRRRLVPLLRLLNDGAAMPKLWSL